MKRFEFDLANLILALRNCYVIYKIPNPVTCHLIWHVGDRLIRFERDQPFGLGLLNCSEFEKVHQEFKKQINQVISNDKESEAYRIALQAQLNIYNNKFINMEELNVDPSNIENSPRSHEDPINDDEQSINSDQESISSDQESLSSVHELVSSEGEPIESGDESMVSDNIVNTEDDSSSD